MIFCGALRFRAPQKIIFQIQILSGFSLLSPGQHAAAHTHHALLSFFSLHMIPIPMPLRERVVHFSAAAIRPWVAMCAALWATAVSSCCARRLLVLIRLPRPRHRSRAFELMLCASRRIAGDGVEPVPPRRCPRSFGCQRPPRRLRRACHWSRSGDAAALCGPCPSRPWRARRLPLDTRAELGATTMRADLRDLWRSPGGSGGRGRALASSPAAVTSRSGGVPETGWSGSRSSSWTSALRHPGHRSLIGVAIGSERERLEMRTSPIPDALSACRTCQAGGWTLDALRQSG